jgi:hypothetical protein
LNDAIRPPESAHADRVFDALFDNVARDPQASRQARQRLHDQFAAQCYERAIALLGKPARLTPGELNQALTLALNVVHHVGKLDAPDPRWPVAAHWLAAKAYARMNDAPRALAMANESLAQASALAPEFAGYAHEAIYRAETLAGRRAQAAAARRLAVACAEACKDRAAARGLLAELSSDGF